MNKRLTDNEGHFIGNNAKSYSSGQRGPITFQNIYLTEKLAHFARERVPERVVHAKGSGAFGIFKPTKDMSEFTRAKLFTENKDVKIAMRFSNVAGELGYPDTQRDVHGFAIKFYTDNGNYDIAGNNTPVFFIDDPIKFPDFIHSQKRDPKTGIRSNENQWDYWSKSPESLHQVVILMSNRGLPLSYRNMHGYGSHTFKWVNKNNEAFWVKYHFKTKQGIKNFSIDDAEKMVSENTDYYRQDLFDSIEQKDFPSWEVKVQIIPYEEGLNYKYDIFDVTKVVSQKDYPLIKIGEITLNQNPNNYFTDIDELAFAPSNFVDGIEPSMDKVLQGRLFSYNDAHRYRLGVNYADLKVNRPINKVENYSRDGYMADNQSGDKNYDPNSDVYSPQSDKKYEFKNNDLGNGIIEASYNSPQESDYYSAPSRLYNEVFNDQDRQDLFDGILSSMSVVKNKEIISRQIELFRKVNEDLANRLFDSLLKQ